MTPMLIPWWPITLDENAKEYYQAMQDWVLRVWDVAEIEGWDHIGGAPFGELMQWTETRFLDGRNCTKPEDEFMAFIEFTNAAPDIQDCACGRDHWEMPMAATGLDYTIESDLVCRVHKRHFPCRKCV